MNKQVFILNGSGGVGKDLFCKILDRIIPIYHYSSAQIPKDIQTMIGSEGDKSEKGRKFLSDLKRLVSDYNDCIFQDLTNLYCDFTKGKLGVDVLIIDIREPKDIARATEIFNAKTILIRNPNIEQITSNPADANVEMYKYDYIIENDGEIDEFRDKIKRFADSISVKRDLEGIVIASDFDNTICMSRYPECGEPITEVIDYLKDCQNRGATIILNTCREGEPLEKAVQWSKAHGLNFDYVNENDPKRTALYGCSSRKISADYYIEDRAILPNDIILKQMRREME